MKDDQAMVAVEQQHPGIQASYTDAMTIEEMKSQVNVIQQVMAGVMKDGVHYGVIPGCGKKPALLKPGAEKITMTFRLAPSYEIEVIELPRKHREYRVTTTLKSIMTGAVLGQGVGSCSTMETKYRFRKAEQICPTCGANAIIKGKKEYGGGWLCFNKNGGCGAKFKDGDPAIENQEMGRVEHDNPADYYNTALKMGKKRSLVDGVLTVTAASDIFTQDIEDGLFGTKEPPESDPTVEHKREEIRDWIMNLAEGDKTEAGNLLKKYTASKTKSTMALTPQQIDSIYETVKADFLTEPSPDVLFPGVT